MVSEFHTSRSCIVVVRPKPAHGFVRRLSGVHPPDDAYTIEEQANEEDATDRDGHWRAVLHERRRVVRHQQSVNLDNTTRATPSYTRRIQIDGCFTANRSQGDFDWLVWGGGRRVFAVCIAFERSLDV